MLEEKEKLFIKIMQPSLNALNDTRQGTCCWGKIPFIQYATFMSGNTELHGKASKHGLCMYFSVIAVFQSSTTMHNALA